MARKLREWWPGASYHIMSRGNHRHNIFRDDEDRQVYLSMLAQVREKHPFLLHAYCLMTNHIHFEIETLETDPGKIMKLLNMKYAIFFNKKYKFIGQLMQGRFRSELIDDDRYFLAINQYIHLNPVKAKMVDHPKDYRWSSYNDYFHKNQPSLVETAKILDYFTSPRQAKFEEFTLAGIKADLALVPARFMLEPNGDEDGEEIQ